MVKTETYTETEVRPSTAAPKKKLPVLLIAFSQFAELIGKSCELHNQFIVGRDDGTDFCVSDPKISGEHFKITTDGGFCLTDLGSTNGTFVNQKPLEEQEHRPLHSGDVIRAGRTLFIFEEDASDIIFEDKNKDIKKNYDISGFFYGPGFIRKLKDFLPFTKRGILLTGPAGVGKSYLAMKAIPKILGRKVPFAFLSAVDKELLYKLRGVDGFFEHGVEIESVLEKYDGGVIVFDEVHALADDVKEFLKTYLETGIYSKYSKKSTTKSTTEFRSTARIIGTTDQPWNFLNNDGALERRFNPIDIPPLSKRLADVPEIFNTVLVEKLSDTQSGQAEEEAASTIKRVQAMITFRHYETLCCACPEGIKIIDKITQDLASELPLFLKSNQANSKAKGMEIVDLIFAKYLSLSTEDDDKYEANKQLIIDTYEQCGKNLSKTEDVLRENTGLPFPRRYLADYLERWGIRLIVSRK